MVKPLHLALGIVSVLAVGPSACRTQELAKSVAANRSEPAPVAQAVKEEAPACATEMVRVTGDYCPNVKQVCLRWMDPPGNVFSEYRCAQYAQPAQCLGERRRLDFCIDRDEYAPAGSDLPLSEQSWTDATATCGTLGKRVCLQSEWQFACEGEEMRPYPYGFARDPEACNADLIDIYEPGRAKIRDLRAKHGAHPKCKSPFGVRDLSGNLEEFVTIDGSNPPRPAMMGAWWQPSRNHCRARQTAHNRVYKGRETGFRCCDDPRVDTID